MKCSALNVDFNGVRFGGQMIGLYPLHNAQLLLLSTNLASTIADRQDLMLTITSTADDFSGGINIDDLELGYLEIENGFLVNFSRLQAATRI